MMHTKLLQGKALISRAQKLGVSMAELYDTQGVLSEPELQRRVTEAERSLRESRLWVIAIIAAVASAISAIAAWAAVICK